MAFCTKQDVRSVLMQSLIGTDVFLVRRAVADSSDLLVRTLERSDVRCPPY